VELDVRLSDRGLHELKGVPGEWRLYHVVAMAGPVPDGANSHGQPAVVTIRSLQPAGAGHVLRSRGEAVIEISRPPHALTRVAEGSHDRVRSVPSGPAAHLPRPTPLCRLHCRA
jgi:hypothetical protein